MMAIISITRLRVRSWRYLPGFLLQTLRIARQAAVADGVIGVQLLRDGNTYWTSTSWASLSAMKAFMLAKPHGPTMRKLLEWCNEAALVHWEQVDAALPSWDEAHRRIERDGRPSKVHHPSPVHTAHKFPAPTARRTGQLRLK